MVTRSARRGARHSDWRVMARLLLPCAVGVSFMAVTPSPSAVVWSLLLGLLGPALSGCHRPLAAAASDHGPADAATASGIHDAGADLSTPEADVSRCARGHGRRCGRLPGRRSYPRRLRLRAAARASTLLLPELGESVATIPNPTLSALTCQMAGCALGAHYTCCAGPGTPPAPTASYCLVFYRPPRSPTASSSAKRERTSITVSGAGEPGFPISTPSGLSVPDG